MKIKRKTLLLAVISVTWFGLGLPGCSVPSKSKTVGTSKTDGIAKSDTARTIAPYFIRATTKTLTPDSEWFIKRWLLLEPIAKPNRTNTVSTDSYIRTAFTTGYFPHQFTV